MGQITKNCLSHCPDRTMRSGTLVLLSFCSLWICDKLANEQDSLHLWCHLSFLPCVQSWDGEKLLVFDFCLSVLLYLDTVVSSSENQSIPTFSLWASRWVLPRLQSCHVIQNWSIRTYPTCGHSGCLWLGTHPNKNYLNQFRDFIWVGWNGRISLLWNG